MIMRRFGFSALVLAALLLGLALLGGRSALGTERGLAASNAWVRLPAVTGRPAAGYFDVRGGKPGDALVGVTSPKAARIELHSMRMEAGVMKMRAEAAFPLAAGGTLRFAPGGNHLMLFELASGLKPGERIPLTLAFASGARLAITAETVAAGGAGPGAAGGAAPGADGAHRH